MSVDSASVEAIVAWVAERDPELVAAAEEVDESLLDWALQLTPGERLLSASNAARELARFARATPEGR